MKTLRAEGKHVPNSFIHRTTDYKRKPNGKGVMKTEKPTISGLVFLQGETEQLTSFLEDYFPSYHLVMDLGGYAVAISHVHNENFEVAE